MIYYICEDCGLRIKKSILKKLQCPRCDHTTFFEEDIPKSELTFVDEYLDEKWEEEAKKKGLA